MFLPIVDIDIGDTADQELEFTLIENINQVGWNKFVEAGDESIELLFDTCLNLPLCKKSARRLATHVHD